MTTLKTDEGPLADEQRPEVRAWKDDARFREFLYVFNIGAPRLMWDPNTLTARFVLGDRLNPREALERGYAAYLQMKEAWRRSPIPAPVGKVLHAVGLAPPCAARPRLKDEVAPFSSGTRFFLVLWIVLVVLAVLCWPLWNSFIDPGLGGKYALLGLKPGASAKEIKKAFRTQALKWHPDQNPDCGKECAKMMDMLQDAKTTLLEQDPHSLSQESKQLASQFLSIIGMYFHVFPFLLRGAADFTTALTSDYLSSPIGRYFVHGLRGLVIAGGMLVYAFPDGFSMTGVVVVLLGFLYLPRVYQIGDPGPDHAITLLEVRKTAKWVLAPVTVASLALALAKTKMPLEEILGMTLLSVLFTAGVLFNHKPYFFTSKSLMGTAVGPWHPTWKYNFRLFSFIYWLGCLALDDIFGFLLGVPTIYRATYLFLIMWTTLQRLIYPWAVERRPGKQKNLPIMRWSSEEWWEECLKESQEQAKEYENALKRHRQGAAVEPKQPTSKVSAKSESKPSEEAADQGPVRRVLVPRAAAGGAAPSSPSSSPSTTVADKKKGLKGKELAKMKHAEEEEEERRGRRTRWIILVSVVVSVVLFFGGLVWLDSVLGGGKVPPSSPRQPAGKKGKGK